MVQNLNFVLRSIVVIGFAFGGCASSAGRVTDYLTGFDPAPLQKRPVMLPLAVGLLMVLPENELSRSTTPSKERLQAIGARIQKELQESRNIRVERIYPTIVIAAAGLSGVSPEVVRQAAPGTPFGKVIVVVPTSVPARKVDYSIVEDQLFVRMDAALVDFTAGQILAAESGQGDYVLAQSYFFNAFSYPRLYYRTFTYAGPFTVVQGDPYKALGEAAFAEAADQIGMKLRQRVDPDTPLP